MKTLVAGLLLSCTLASPALRADTIKGDEEACKTLATLAYGVVQLKHRGQDWKTTQADLQSAIKESKGMPNALVNDPDDEKLVMGVLEAAYSSPAVDPLDIARGIYADCMAAGKAKSAQPLI